MKPYLQVALIFAFTQLLGIYTGVALIEGKAIDSEIGAISVAPIPSPDDPMNAFIFLLYILFGAGIVLVVSRYYKGMLGFQLLEAMVIFSASSIVFLAIGLSLFSLNFYTAFFGGAICGLALAAAKFITTKAKNAAAMISSAGVGALFGFSLGFLPTVLFAILLSIYDYIAVFKTKHMIAMARELSTRQLSFSVTAKQLPKRGPQEKTEAYVDRAMKEGERLDLGTGDISVPLMLAVSAYQPSFGPNGLLYSLTVAAGSTISLILLLRFVSRERVFLPALPPICLGGLLALLLVKLAGF